MPLEEELLEELEEELLDEELEELELLDELDELLATERTTMPLKVALSTDDVNAMLKLRSLTVVVKRAGV